MNRSAICILLLVACLIGAATIAGCSAPARPVFGHHDPALSWPKPPRQARIVYVGEISKSSDLNPSQNPLAGISEVAFGKADAKGLLAPFALCTDGADRLFVADPGAQIVHVFDLNHRQYAQWKPVGGIPFTQPVGIAWDPAGRLIVSDSMCGRLFVFDARGKYVGEIGAGIVQKPAGIAIDHASRNIFVADVVAHQIVVLSPSGELIARIGQRGEKPGEFNYPTNVAVDREGYVYVTDALNFRVQTFSPDLKPVRTLGLPGDAPGYFGQPKGIALDSDDHLYVVDARQEMVQIFDVGKRLLLFFGGEGHGPGQFWLPAGICIDAHNRIWIADTYNRRVCVFDYLPEKQP
jgi:DNA-binding beta-propeller fold protein YncE